MKKKYQKVIAFMLISLCIIVTFTPVSSKNTILSDDQLDQEQTISNSKDYIYSEHWRVQSFKPTTKTLTRIQLYINKIGEITSDFEISIKDSLTGQSLTNCSLPSSEIPTTNPEWIDFNFLDISVTINETYYIICKTNTGDQSNSYNWYEAFDNPYGRGIKYYSDDNGVTWQQNPDYDFCFKTYGQKAELYIPYITGGFGWNIYYGIKNIGTIETTDIEVDITFSGGLILTGKKYTDNFNEPLPPDEMLEKTLSPVIGIGPTTITITVRSPQIQTTSKTVEAFLFLFYIYVSPS